MKGSASMIEERPTPPEMTHAEESSAPSTMYCINCGWAIAQQPVHMTSGMSMTCPSCKSTKGRTSVSPEEFGKDLKRYGKGYLEKAGVEHLSFK